VVAVGDGEQAIARIPTERPDIVLADIGMPKRSGYEVSAFVKGRPDLRHVPVLLLAGAFEPVDDAKAEQAGCDGVLVKPFEPQHVIARVRELLNGAKGSPTQAAAANVARPVERLSKAPEPPAQPRAAVPAPVPTAATAPPPSSSAAAPPPVGQSLDDYFDRLDAAFATIATPAPSPVDDRADAELHVPTLDRVLAHPPVQPPPMEPPDVTPTLSTTPSPAPKDADMPARVSRKDAPDTRNVIADVFGMMLAAEQGDSQAKPVRLTLGRPEPVITDEMIDEVVRRVLQKLAPDAARAVVVQVVSEVAERLVRAEIARIRGTN
jgi:CheY-like chemotaxis protein